MKPTRRDPTSSTRPRGERDARGRGREREREREQGGERDEGEDGEEISLAELSTDFFLLGMQIRGGQIELPACDVLRRRVLQLFESMKTRAHRGGALPNDVEDVRYALAAFLDEVIQYSEWPGKEEWAAKPLQAVLFSESKAGARFFDRLTDVRRRSRSATEVYYTCLVLGFQGEFRMGSPHELEDLIEDLRRELTAGAARTISVHGKRPEALSLGGRSLPLVPLAAACLLIGVGVAVALYLILSSSTTGIVEMLGQIGRG